MIGGDQGPKLNKGSAINNFAEFAPRFGSDLFDPKLQNHPAKGGTISGILRLRIGQRWPEDGMRKCQVIYAPALNSCVIFQGECFAPVEYEILLHSTGQA